MFIRRAALAAMLVWGCAHGAHPHTLTLEDALARVLADHPSLRATGVLSRVLEAEAAQAAQRPPLHVEIEVENAPSTGERGAFSAAETTLSLAGVLERGGKRAARHALAARRIDAQAARRTATELDLAAETARRYLDLAGAEARTAIAAQDVDQRKAAVEAARQRMRAGAAPESVVLAAEAALIRASLLVARAEAEREAAWQRLQLLWGGGEPVAATVGGVLALPPVAPLGDLLARVEHSPELRAFADEQRIREARLQLARSAARADVEWRLGARRLEAGDDVALVAGLSLPLGARSRAAPAISAASAELEALAFERESSRRQLASVLTQAHGDYEVAALEVRQTRETLLPSLERAAAAAEHAWRAGAAPWQEWAQIQSDIVAARAAALASALQAHRALIEMQRLTADPVVFAPETQP